MSTCAGSWLRTPSVLALCVVSATTASCGKPPAASPSTRAGEGPSPKAEAGESSPTFDSSAKGASPWLVSDPPDLRALTFIVEVKPPEDIALAYDALASRYGELRPLMEAHNEGGFGSGFLVVARGASGKSAYVVTNQHVVGMSTSVMLGREGSNERVEVPVRHVDPVYDLAIVELTQEAIGIFEIERGFGFSSQAARDQDVVVASGFPGIQGDPSYQVTRGHVSNERVLIDAEGTGDELAHIQHTAPIDPGSSGGPLLDERGQVLGINTLKVQWREGVGLAVPTAIVLEALDAVRTKHPSRLGQTAARQLCERLLADVASEEYLPRADRVLSERLVAREGGRSLWLLPKDDSRWQMEFMVDPAQVMATALGFRLWRELEPLEARACTPKSAPTDERQTFVIEPGASSPGSKGKTLTIFEEQGVLKVLDFTFSPGTGQSFLDPPSARAKKWKPSL